MGTIIGLVFDTPEDTHNEEHVCPHCGKKYKNQENLDKHIKDKHPEAAEDPTDAAPEGEAEAQD